MKSQTPHYESLLTMINFESKRELEKYARGLTIYQQDLIILIKMAQNNLLFPYKYANYFDRHLPEHLFPKPSEREAISNNGIGEFKSRETNKFINKLTQLQKERKSRAAHLFYTPNHQYWNLFYFDNRDLKKSKNHWEHGSHIHFISDIWPNLSLKTVWEKVQTGNLSFNNKLHIRYETRDFYSTD